LPVSLILNKKLLSIQAVFKRKGGESNGEYLLKLSLIRCDTDLGRRVPADRSILIYSWAITLNSFRHQKITYLNPAINV